MTQATKERLQRIGHVLAGIVILLHGYTAFEDHHQSWWVFILLGTCFIAVALFHHRIKQRYKAVDGLLFMIEGISLAIIANDYHHAGKQYLPVVYALCAGTYVCLSLYTTLYKNVR